MAKATKAKAKGSKKKATRAKGEDRNKTPALECPHVAIFTRPHTTESSGKQAAKLTDFLGHVASWKAAVRKAFVEGIDLPEFPVSKFYNPNTGQMSRTAYEALVEAYNEAETPGSVEFPPRYSPVMVDAAHAMNAVSLRRGSVKKHPKPPKDWDEKLYGNWWHEWKDEDGEVQRDPSGWHFDSEMPRRCHAKTAESLIDDPDENILTFGNLRIVCGTGSHDGAAAFKIWQTARGNYRTGDEARKRMSLAGIKAVRDVVFKIEDRPNNGGGLTVKGNWLDVREMVFMPGQVLTAGNLFDGKGTMLTAKEIRALDGDTKGLRFKTLEAPIVGKVVSWSKLWAEIKVAGRATLKAMRDRGGRSTDYEAGDTQTKSITNICVNGKRVDPSEAFPFGLKGGQTHMPAYIVANGEGKIEGGHFGMGVVIGERANAARNVGVHEARGEAEVEAPAPKAAKPKADPKPKPKSKKAAKPKAAKKVAAAKATKPTPDAAPPVESDTADDPEPVVVEAADETVGAETED